MRTLMSLLRQVCFVMAIVVAIFFSQFTFGATWYVDWNASGTNSGTDINPWTSLQTALTSGSVTNGDEIRIAQGTYKPTTTTTRSISFEISTKNLILQGGWINNGGGSWSFSPATATTTLSGDIHTGAATDNSYTVLKLSYSGAVPSGSPRTVIEYLTITGGYANGGSGQTDGGGIQVTNGSPRIDNCKIIDNAADRGGGVFVNGASPYFTRCTIESNESLSTGGTRYGAGLYSTGSGFVRVINCTIKANIGAIIGAGLMAEYSSTGHEMLVLNCLIVDNETGGSGGFGSPSEGGGIAIQGANDISPTVNIINTTISNNTAERGGGIKVIFGAPNQHFLRNSIVWGNTAINLESGHEIALRAGEITIDYSDVQAPPNQGETYIYGVPTYGSGNVNNNQGADPVFVGAGNYRLLCGSPCINTANPTTSIIPADSFDLDGNSYTSSERTLIST